MSSPFNRAFSSKSPFKQNHTDSKDIALEGVGGIRGEKTGGAAGKKNALDETIKLWDSNNISADERTQWIKEIQAKPTKPTKPTKPSDEIKDYYSKYEKATSPKSSNMGPRRKSSSPLNHMEPKDNPHNPDPEHVHPLDNSPKMVNEYGQNQQELLNEKITAYNDFNNKVQEALDRAGGQWPSQKLFDAYKAKNDELALRFQVSKDSIDRLNFPNEAKRQNALSDLEGLLFDID